MKPERDLFRLTIKVHQATQVIQVRPIVAHLRVVVWTLRVAHLRAAHLLVRILAVPVVREVLVLG